ncbi:MAG TPA: hypothetical protein VGR82_17570 [Methylomirabilota bacterium]|jgi:hypothetical protein|nr:hypothetical protein [Methylomirabilota bacterium]
MILDERTEFADATTIPTATGRSLLGDVYDLGIARNASSPPLPLYLVIQIDTAVTSAGAAEVSFELVSDAQAAIAVDGTATQHYKSFAFPKATLVAGFTIVVPLPGEQPAYERFLGVISNVTTSVLTGGKANAFLTHDPKQWKALPDAI